ncbi:hypothetical protein HHL28_03950 [Aerophototrophica crusticola]|uniref:Efflux transporter periplasmic adaptor subunit n=1 Tax=Aerophototrophica crusticola TaxID=1709002 RepID=A0A858R594_9PROT|nr:hypothetical protein HHL28_03950 [Rhodospirillaceae bacterium B3]
MLEDGKPKAVPVKFGLQDTDWVEIVEGPLKPGDQIILRADRADGSGASGSGRPPGPPMRF